MKPTGPFYTPSAQQVRQPINRKGFGRWRNYEPWLGELKEALGDTLDELARINVGHRHSVMWH